MNAIQRLNAATMLNIRHELLTSYPGGIVRYSLREEDAAVLLRMTDEEVITAAISTSEPVFTIRPIMAALQSHASGSEFDLLLSVVKTNETVTS
jgi:hypothetical protein